ncbi:MAG: cyclomaltodextrinase N-terminal domain-containing protein [Tannerellaceae bacterium]|nr:cyclomaltodextrinase N-terminal domain-containing protein [Tannerellaceae bacterium]
MNIQRIEPPCWWIGMKTPLQLMIYGKDLAGGEVQTDTKGITIREVHPAESPNYLFADIEISPELTPGEYLFTTHKGTEKAGFTYRIEKRRKNAASRTSYTSADMVYLLMPDRFANGDPSIDNTPDTTEKIDRTDPSGRHGGDLQGIIDHLDYLVDLGGYYFMANSPTGRQPAKKLLSWIWLYGLLSYRPKVWK